MRAIRFGAPKQSKYGCLGWGATPHIDVGQTVLGDCQRCSVLTQTCEKPAGVVWRPSGPPCYHYYRMAVHMKILLHLLKQIRRVHDGLALGPAQGCSLLSKHMERQRLRFGRRGTTLRPPISEQVRSRDPFGPPGQCIDGSEPMQTDQAYFFSDIFLKF
jgi:hypothetical protein